MSYLLNETACIMTESVCCMSSPDLDVISGGSCQIINPQSVKVSFAVSYKVGIVTCLQGLNSLFSCW